MRLSARAERVVESRDLRSLCRSKDRRQQAGAPMYVNVAVLKETQPHERRVALVPSVVPKLIKLGAKLHMQTGAGHAIKLDDAAFKDVAFIDDRRVLVS